MTDNEVAIVTGASRGLGLALARGLADAGRQVVVDGRDAATLRAAVGDVAGVTAVPGDVTDPVHRNELVRTAEDLGRLTLLVNNAGVLGPSPQPAVVAYPLDALHSVLDANLVAPWALLQRAYATLRANGGAVLNVTSDAAVEPYEGWAGYAAGKAALEQVSAILAAEEPDLRVWWVDPGDLRTRMHQEAFPGEDISDRPLPETAVPAFLRLVTDRPASGRYRAADLPAEAAT
ncbi:MAG: SDR family oxidoreductase [Streptosporangiales bacterium]|nr:SDR family oxidoreductase [Streptosporangiales bacterium]MBO0891242.1 SDR family oxidoreductase [Acidothermales bacterium]